MLTLALRTVPLFAVIVGFAMALGAYMNYSGVRSAYLDLIASRMEMVVDDVGNIVESAVSVGIPPAEQVTLPAILERLASSDPLIQSIDAVAPDGTILFSNMPARAGTVFSSDHTNVFELTRPVLNDFGVEEVRLVIRYDRLTPIEHVNRFGAAVLADALPAGLIAVLAGSLAAFVLLSGLHRRAERIADHGQADAIDSFNAEIDRLKADQAT
jgi:hypothetical protein